ncbi:cobalamin biosynthesis protein [Rhodococcoides trifolii]|uniref:Cobalamin biosynthesis protein n=1 Tax=Rhodococcoides trifolii TaxID=908250 RepID=A0A917CX26_9NOCA|nr:sirohydrochlorin chelatase [Rhodococcus trifolii]GGG02821.1 cobalamin biosynthesis protein [Rhodococcus trifolii]
MTRPALVAVAHGSRDPRAEATLRELVDALAVALPNVDVRLGFLSLNSPSVDTVLDELVASGHTHAVVVPMLLGDAFHARVDLPEILRAATNRHPRLVTTQTPVLGADSSIIDAMRARIIGTGTSVDDSGVGILMPAVGSSDPRANVLTRRIAPRLTEGTSWTASVACFATSAEPDAARAVTALLDSGVERIVVAPWFLAPGRLLDKVTDIVDRLTPNAVHADPLGAHPGVVDVIAARYGSVVAALNNTGGIAA